MKKVLLILITAIPLALWAQCNDGSATDCDCLDGSSNCDLLPDLTASFDLLLEADETVETPGLLELSVGTPNIGHGPLRVLPTDNYVCGLDTIYSPGGLLACPDGSLPHQIIQQELYHKSGSDMTFWERDAGTMTYHPDHGHFHTDDWGIYTLRSAVAGEDNPLAWPIIGEGSKVGFCLMDLANCATPSNYGYCREDDGTVITNDIENYGLGGGNFSCAIDHQGISVGYLDIYDYYLDGMYINIPAGTCNGDYMIVVQIDPNNNYIEESDDNNLIAVPFTLTEQPEDVEFMPLTYIGGSIINPGTLTICASETVELSAAPVGTSYLWSNGATTSSIIITEPGSYSCYVERICGPLYTDTLIVEIITAIAPIIDPVDAVCAGDVAVIEATAGGVVDWYDAPIGGIWLGTGTTFITSELFSNTSFYAENIHELISPFEGFVGEPEHQGSDYSGFGSPYNGFMVFDAVSDFTLNSVKVFTDYPGERKIELRDASDVVLQSLIIDIPNGTTVIDLNFDIPVGTNYHLGTNDDTNDGTFGDLAPRLKRSDEGTNFPYDVDGVVSITNTSLDESRWYYFYDWNVTGTSVFTCPSDRTSVDVEVKVCSGIGDVSNINSLNIYPNPTDDKFNIELNTEVLSDINISVTNITGQQLFATALSNISGTVNIPVDLKDAPMGVYQINITSDEKTISRNVVVE